MSLSDWLRNRWLTAQQGSPGEIKALLAMADRDLKSCRAEEMVRIATKLRSEVTAWLKKEHPGLMKGC